MCTPSIGRRTGGLKSPPDLGRLSYVRALARLTLRHAALEISVVALELHPAHLSRPELPLML